MKRYFADKTCLNIIRLLIILLTFAIVILSYIYLYFIPIVMWMMMIVCAVAGIFVSSVYLPLYFRNACYYISDIYVIKRTGVFIKVRQVMKIESIEFVTSITMPLSRFTGFNFLVINAFGGSMVLMFLSRRDMEEITKRLERYYNITRRGRV